MIRLSISSTPATDDPLALPVSNALDALARSLANAAHATALAQRDPHRTMPSELADSIGVETTGDNVLVVAAAPYAALVEFGTRTRAARPFMRPAIEQMRQKLGELS